MVVIGALSFLGSQLVSELVTSGQHVRAVEHDSCIRADDELLWYRKEQLLLHHGVSIRIANLSNQSQVEEHLFDKNEKKLDKPVVLLYVPPVSSCGELSNMILSNHLDNFVIVLETLRKVSPSTRVVLSSLSKPKVTSHDSHVTIEQVWMDTFELTLSTYHSLYDIAMTIVRTSGVYGPWSDIAMEMYKMNKHQSREDSFKYQQELGLCLYIGDVTRAFHKALNLTSSCDVLDLGYCNASMTSQDVTSALVSSPGSEYTHTLLDITSLESPHTGLQKSLSWAKSYLQQQATSSGNSIVFSSYFTSVEDSQRGWQMVPNRFQYMSEWFTSLKKLQLQAVIFHDGLEPGFQHRLMQFYTNISFQLVPSLKGRSTNDARFYAYLDYLEHHHDIAHVLLTDISDVRFQMDPFELMSLLGNNWLYIGADIDIFPSMRTMPWLNQRLRGCFGNSSLERGHKLHPLLDLDTVYNAGTIGGRRDVMMAVLFRIVEYLNTTPPQLNCNMPAVNFAIHKHFYDRVFTGFPLSSRFLRRQTSPKGVYIVHK